MMRRKTDTRVWRHAPGFLAGGLLLAMPAMAAPPPPAAAGRSVTVVNHARQPIREVHMTPAGDEGWGGNRLTARPLVQGRSASIALGRDGGCRYDIQVVYGDDAAEENRGVDICRTRQLSFDGTGAKAAARAQTDISVTNRSSMDVTSVFISPASRTEWGDDWLGRDVLEPRANRDVAYRGTCSADIRVVYKNGSAEERHRYDVCANTNLAIAPGWTINDPSDADTDTAVTMDAPAPSVASGPKLEVTNQAGSTLVSLNLYPEGTEEQGDDLLGSDTVDNHAQKAVSFDRGGKCRFTMRVRFQGDDDEKIRHNLDLCATPKLTLTASMMIDSAIINAGTLPIVALYIDAPTANRGPDRLGDGVIARGAKFTLSPPENGVCQYRVTGIFRDGRAATADSDLCKDKPVVLQ